MARCKHCEREMTTSDGCIANPVTVDGKLHQPVPVAQESCAMATGRCGDCGAVAGKLHHPGCDNEKCPACGWQIISCGCQP